MECTVAKNNIHIADSYKVSKWQFRKTLIRLREEHPGSEVWHRSIASLCLEWACHNTAYFLHFKRDRTKDVDLNWPQPFRTRLLYSVVGIIAIVLTK